MSVSAAAQFADGLLASKSPVIGAAETKAVRRSWWAIGDPQASFATFATILDTYGLLGSDGRLRPEVGLVSIGDHFDYGKGPEYAAAGREGERVLRFLAAHPPQQAVILLGNHDTVRVQELAFESDETFQAARVAAFELMTLAPEKGRTPSEAFSSALARFNSAHPGIPSASVVLRDFSTFCTAQRVLVQHLLLADRVRLGVSAHVADGTAALINHAGITQREVQMLKPAPISAKALAIALRAVLKRAVESVADQWKTGAAAALDLSPLHAPGYAGAEGGGMLYHRPANPDRSDADRPWEAGGPGPRRYSPYSLPPGLVQVCGHSGHRKLRAELRPWVEPDALAQQVGGLRTLSCEGEVVRYRMGVHPAAPNAATVYLIDGEMNSVDPKSYPLLRLAAVDP